MVYEDYLEEMDKLERKLIDSEGECEDNEYYHVRLDDMLVNFLKDMGYKELAEKYEKASEHFWYS